MIFVGEVIDNNYLFYQEKRQCPKHYLMYAGEPGGQSVSFLNQRKSVSPHVFSSISDQ